MHEFAKFYPISENCDFDNYSSSQYSSIEGAIKSIPDGTYDECMSTIKTIFDNIDLNNSGYIDRCEDAKFLMYANDGNKEFATNYAGTGSLLEMQNYCKYAVIDAFDRPVDTDYFWLQNLISRMAGVFPFNFLFFSEDRGVVYWLKDKDSVDHDH